MKLLSIFVVGSLGTSMTREEANTFLARNRRGPGFMEELKDGNLERECIEEDCDANEFNEASMLSVTFLLQLVNAVWPTHSE